MAQPGESVPPAASPISSQNAPQYGVSSSSSSASNNNNNNNNAKSGKWPTGSRLFLGNLASEKTSREELHAIFSKYGPIMGNIALRKSFGFIQFENAEHARVAMEAENGRIIGGIRVDIKLANSSEGPKAEGKNKRRREDASSGWDQGGPSSGGGGGGGGGPPQGFKRRNVNSGWNGGPAPNRGRGPPPPRGSRNHDNNNWGPKQNWGGNDEWGYNNYNDGDWEGGNWDDNNNWNNQGGSDWNNNGGWDNNDGWNQASFCEVVYLGYDQSRYAGGIAQMLRDRLDVSVDSYFIEKMTIADLFHDAKRRGVRYVLVVGDQNEQTGTVNLNKIFRQGRTEANRNLTQQEAVDMIAQSEGITPQQPPQRSHLGPPQMPPPHNQQQPPHPMRAPHMQQQQYLPPQFAPQPSAPSAQQPVNNQPLMEAMGVLLGSLQQPSNNQAAPNPLLLLTQALAQASTSNPANLGTLQSLLNSLQAPQNNLNVSASQPPTQPQPLQQPQRPPPSSQLQQPQTQSQPLQHPQQPLSYPQPATHAYPQQPGKQQPIYPSAPQQYMQLVQQPPPPQSYPPQLPLAQPQQYPMPPSTQPQQPPQLYQPQPQYIPSATNGAVLQQHQQPQQPPSTSLLEAVEKFSSEI